MSSSPLERRRAFKDEMLCLESLRFSTADGGEMSGADVVRIALSNPLEHSCVSAHPPERPDDPVCVSFGDADSSPHLFGDANDARIAEQAWRALSLSYPVFPESIGAGPLLSERPSAPARDRLPGWRAALRDAVDAMARSGAVFEVGEMSDARPHTSDVDVAETLQDAHVLSSQIRALGHLAKGSLNSLGSNTLVPGTALYVFDCIADARDLEAVRNFPEWLRLRSLSEAAIRPAARIAEHTASLVTPAKATKRLEHPTVVASGARIVEHLLADNPLDQDHPVINRMALSVRLRLAGVPSETLPDVLSGFERSLLGVIDATRESPAFLRVLTTPLAFDFQLATEDAPAPM